MDEFFKGLSPEAKRAAFAHMDAAREAGSEGRHRKKSLGSGDRHKELTKKTQPKASSSSSPQSADTGSDKPKLSRAETHVMNQITDLESKPGAFVPITKLRDRLAGAGMSQEGQDKLLKKLSQDGHIHLVPDSNKSALTERDWRSAFYSGSSRNREFAKHLVARDV